MLPLKAQANLDWLCQRVKMEICDQRRYNRSGGASIPSESTSYRMNPSTVSVQKGFGAELVTASSGSDFGFVTGTGKVGAAVSPSSMEDTFFANMPLEDVDDYIARKQNDVAYRSKKYTLATATELIKNNRLLRPTVGLIVKHNTLSKRTSPGAGVSLGIGPFSIGYAANRDDYYHDYGFMIEHIRYTTKTVTFGAKLPNFAIDYSIVTNELVEVANTKVIILSMTFFWRSFMFTYANRKEDSYRPAIDPETRQATFVNEKNASFLGLQYAFRKKYLVGIFNNYFLNNELSLGFTAFF